MEKKKSKSGFKIAMNILLVVLFVVASLMLVRNLVFSPIVVSERSMTPTLKNGDYGYANTTSWRKNSIKRFDIIIFKYEDSLLIKRVIAKENEQIRFDAYTGDLYIYDVVVPQNFLPQEIRDNPLTTCNGDYRFCRDNVTVPEDSYLVLGDNRGNSLDSRSSIGFVKQSQIYGVLSVIFAHCGEVVEGSSSICHDKKYISPRFY